MNNTHGPYLTPLFTDVCRSPTISQSQPPSVHLSPTYSYRETTVKQDDDGHANNGLASCWGPTVWNKDTGTPPKARSQRSSTTNGSVQSPGLSRRSSNTTHNEDRKDGEDRDGWLYLTPEPTRNGTPEPPNQHTQKIRENDREEEGTAERRENKTAGDGQEMDDDREHESERKVEGHWRRDDVQKMGNDNPHMASGTWQGDSQVELPEGDDSQPLTPKPITNELSESQPQSPRIHIQTMQEQDLAGISNIQPPTDPIETFLDDWSDDEMDSARLEKERRKLKRSRVEVVRFRSYLRVKHEELKVRESAKVDADNIFMSFVRESIAADPLQNSATLRHNIDLHFQAVQSTRDEYGPLEDEYNELLMKLDDMEYELARIEGRVYSHGVSKPTLADSVTSGHSLSNSESVLGSSWSDQKPAEPLHIEYLSRVGDLDVALERLAHMNEELDALTIDQETKARVGVEFDQELKTFLEELPKMHASLVSEIANIQDDVDRLRGQCIEAGIDVEFEDDESSTSNESGQIIEENNPGGHGKSILQEIQRPHIQCLITKFDENNKSDRINRWLLYSLQTSKLDAFRFAQYYLDFFAFSNCQNVTAQWELQWQQNILSTWSTDGANKPASAFRRGFTLSYSVLPVAEEYKLGLDSPMP